MDSEKITRDKIRQTEEALEDAFARSEAGENNEGEIEELNFDLDELYRQLELLEQAKHA